MNRSQFFADVPDTRRRLMSKVKSTGSKPEILVRRSAHRLGFRYRLHVRDLPGTPDLVFPRLRKVIFVHGCFWHRHANCHRTTMPKARAEYWQKKFDDNVRRDERSQELLRNLGWEVLVLWECEAKDTEWLEEHLTAFLSSQSRARR